MAEITASNLIINDNVSGPQGLISDNDFSSLIDNITARGNGNFEEGLRDLNLTKRGKRRVLRGERKFQKAKAKGRNFELGDNNFQVRDENNSLLQGSGARKGASEQFNAGSLLGLGRDVSFLAGALEKERSDVIDARRNTQIVDAGVELNNFEDISFDTSALDNDIIAGVDNTAPDPTRKGGVKSGGVKSGGGNNPQTEPPEDDFILDPATDVFVRPDQVGKLGRQPTQITVDDITDINDNRRETRIFDNVSRQISDGRPIGPVNVGYVNANSTDAEIKKAFIEYSRNRNQLGYNPDSSLIGRTFDRLTGADDGAGDIFSPGRGVLNFAQFQNAVRTGQFNERKEFNFDNPTFVPTPEAFAPSFGENLGIGPLLRNTGIPTHFGDGNAASDIINSVIQDTGVGAIKGARPVINALTRAGRAPTTTSTIVKQAVKESAKTGRTVGENIGFKGAKGANAIKNKARDLINAGKNKILSPAKKVGKNVAEGTKPLPKPTPKVAATVTKQPITKIMQNPTVRKSFTPEKLTAEINAFIAKNPAAKQMSLSNGQRVKLVGGAWKLFRYGGKLSASTLIK